MVINGTIGIGFHITQITLDHHCNKFIALLKTGIISRYSKSPDLINTFSLAIERILPSVFSRYLGICQ